MNTAIKLTKENARLQAEIEEMTKSRRTQIAENKLKKENYIRKNAVITIEGKDFKLDEIDYRQTYSYDDCPYTPGWISGSLEINEKGKHRPYFVSNCRYWKTKWEKMFSDFEVRYGDSLEKYLPPIIHDERK